MVYLKALGIVIVSAVIIYLLATVLRPLGIILLAVIYLLCFIAVLIDADKAATRFYDKHLSPDLPPPAVTAPEPAPFPRMAEPAPATPTKPTAPTEPAKPAHTPPPDYDPSRDGYMFSLAKVRARECVLTKKQILKKFGRNPCILKTIEIENLSRAILNFTGEKYKNLIKSIETPFNLLPNHSPEFRLSAYASIYFFVFLRMRDKLSSEDMYKTMIKTNAMSLSMAMPAGTNDRYRDYCIGQTNGTIRRLNKHYDLFSRSKIAREDLVRHIQDNLITLGLSHNHSTALLHKTLSAQIDSWIDCEDKITIPDLKIVQTPRPDPNLKFSEEKVIVLAGELLALTRPKFDKLNADICAETTLSVNFSPVYMILSVTIINCLNALAMRKTVSSRNIRHILKRASKLLISETYGTDADFSDEKYCRSHCELLIENIRTGYEDDLIDNNTFVRRIKTELISYAFPTMSKPFDDPALNDVLDRHILSWIYEDVTKLIDFGGPY